MFGEEQGLGAVRPNIIQAVARPALIPHDRLVCGGSRRNSALFRCEMWRQRGFSSRILMEEAKFLSYFAHASVLPDGWVCELCDFVSCMNILRMINIIKHLKYTNQTSG